MKPTEKGYDFLKTGTRNFQNSPEFERSACFYVTISENFEDFQYFSKIFNRFSEKRKPFSIKLEHLFLVENTKIKNASFPYQTAISEAIVKTNRMVSTKWTYHKEQSFSSN